MAKIPKKKKPPQLPVKKVKVGPISRVLRAYNKKLRRMGG